MHMILYRSSSISATCVTPSFFSKRVGSSGISAQCKGSAKGTKARRGCGHSGRTSGDLASSASPSSGESQPRFRGQTGLECLEKSIKTSREIMLNHDKSIKILWMSAVFFSLRPEALTSGCYPGVEVQVLRVRHLAAGQGRAGGQERRMAHVGRRALHGPRPTSLGFEDPFAKAWPIPVEVESLRGHRAPEQRRMETCPKREASSSKPGGNAVGPQRRELRLSAEESALATVFLRPHPPFQRL